MTGKKAIEKERGLEPDILSLIETDHEEIRELFDQLENNKTSKKSQQLFDKLYQELALHAHAEEIVFYPAMQEYQETRGFLEEAEKEHNSVKILLEQMNSLNSGDAEFVTKFTYLKDSMLHHIEEEENEIFPVVRECMEEELQSLGQEFQAAKEHWRNDVKAALERK